MPDSHDVQTATSRGGGAGRRGESPTRPDGYPHPTSSSVSAVMRSNQKVNTRPELAVRRLLHGRGLRYRVNHQLILPDLKVRPDIVFTRKRIAVFIDGCFWHGCTEHGTKPRANQAYWRRKIEGNQARDQRIDSVLRAHGWIVLRVWEHEPPDLVAQMVESVFLSRSS